MRAAAVITWRAALATATLSLIITPILAMAATPHNVLLITDKYRTWRLSGAFSFTVGRYGDTTISCNGVTVAIHEGDKVTININSINKGRVWLGRNGWLDIKGIHVASITVNGKRVCTNTDLRLNTRVAPGSLASSLQLMVTGEGWTKLRVDGTTIIQGESSDVISLSGLTPYPRMNIDLKGRYYRGGASSYSVGDPNDVPVITPEGLLASIPVLAASAALSSRILDRRASLVTSSTATH